MRRVWGSHVERAHYFDDCGAILFFRGSEFLEKRYRSRGYSTLRPSLRSEEDS
jgi:hypothetical protein